MPDGSRNSRAPVPDHLRRIAALYVAHFSFVTRVLRRFGIPDADLEDAAQETFLIAHRRIDRFEGRASERTWLYAIAVRVASTLRRSRRRDDARRLAAGEDLHAALPIDPEAELGNAEAARILEALLDQLDDDQRVVFVLIELEGIKAAEISQALGVNLRTVYSRLRLARARFERGLHRFLSQEQGRSRRAVLRRELLERSTPHERAPRHAAVAALLARIDAGDLPITPGWQDLAPMPKASASVVAPLAIVGVTGAAGIALVIALGGGPVDRADAVLPAAEPIASTPSEPTSSMDPATPVPRSTSVADDPQVPADAAIEPAQLARPRTTTRTSVTSSSVPASAGTDTEPKSGTARGDDDFDVELALLERARAAIRANDIAAALGALDQHAAAFPSGQLATEARRTRIIALCQAERDDEARRLAMRLSEGRPDAAPMRIFERFCAPK